MIRPSLPSTRTSGDLARRFVGHGDGVAVGECAVRGRNGRRQARRELVALPSASAAPPCSLGALALAVMATWPAIALDAVGVADRHSVATLHKKTGAHLIK